LTTHLTTIAIEDIARSSAFRALSTIAGIEVDLRYASANNFVGRNVYGNHDCAWLHVEAAAKLQGAVSWLADHAPNVRLAVLDALRPHRIQEALWAALAGTGLQMYLAPPSIGSLHSYGMAVDVTLRDGDGKELDMGTSFDAMVPASHPEHEAQFLADGSLTQAQVSHRRLLRSAMRSAGFVPIKTEWWHFDATDDRAIVRSTYPRVL
jgi:D-alanyl-D-alanine dipeptidase